MKNLPGIAPGQYIRKELKERGWTQADLAQITNKPVPTINRIINGKHAIMPEMAIALSKAFEDNPKAWMMREAAYQLSKIYENKDEYNEIERRAFIYKIAPIKEMESRNWIRKTTTITETEKELCRFFEIKSIYDEPALFQGCETRSND